MSAAPEDSTSENSSATKKNQTHTNRAVVNALAWTGFGRYAGQLFRWVSTFFVARLLSPADYGLVGMTTVFTGFIAIIAEFGVGTAALKMRDLEHPDLARLNGLSLATGAIAMFGGWFLAVPIARFFGRNELIGIVGWSALGFVFSAAQTVPSAVLQRELKFKALALFDLATSVLLAALVLLLAIAGVGYWALVIPPIAIGLAKAVWLHNKASIGVDWPDISPIRKAASFGAWVFAGRLGAYTMATSDFLVVGRMLGESALGKYTLAWDLANTPNDQVNGLVARVSSAFYSAIQHDEREVGRLFLKLLSSVALLSVPMVIGLAAVAPEFVSVVLGDKWAGAISVLQVLCLLNAFRIITILSMPVLQMLGEVRYTAIVTLISLLYLPLLFAFGARYSGPDGVAMAWLLGYPPILALYAQRTLRRLKMGVRELAASLAPAMLCSGVMYLAVTATRSTLPIAAAELLRLAVLILVGVAVYTTLVVVFFRERAVSMLRVLRGRA
jgi:teichuronic acid exporter